MVHDAVVLLRAQGQVPETRFQIGPGAGRRCGERTVGGGDRARGQVDLARVDQKRLLGQSGRVGHPVVAGAVEAQCPRGQHRVGVVDAHVAESVILLPQQVALEPVRAHGQFPAVGEERVDQRRSVGVAGNRVPADRDRRQFPRHCGRRRRDPPEAARRGVTRLGQGGDAENQQRGFISSH